LPNKRLRCAKETLTFSMERSASMAVNPAL
jgi:hypothetical protein